MLSSAWRVGLFSSLKGGRWGLQWGKSHFLFSSAAPFRVEMSSHYADRPQNIKSSHINWIMLSSQLGFCLVSPQNHRGWEFEPEWRAASDRDQIGSQLLNVSVWTNDWRLLLIALPLWLLCLLPACWLFRAQCLPFSQSPPFYSRLSLKLKIKKGKTAEKKSNEA